MVHRDLKPDNLLLHKVIGGGVVGKVGDVGLCALATSKASRQPPAESWAAPEITRPKQHPITKRIELKEYVYSYATDVWSLGLALWVVLSRQSQSNEGIAFIKGSGYRYHTHIAGAMREGVAVDVAKKIWWSEAWVDGVGDSSIRLALAHLLLKCVAHLPTQRVGMRDVLNELGRIMIKLAP
jgi:serine/threonine protein kinase